MKEAEFKKKWGDEKPLFEAWGKYVLQAVQTALQEKGKNLDIFLKVPAKHRLKTDESLLDKAFYRGKDYEDPYNDIEDKVGIRFVVLLLYDIKEISDIIEKNTAWKYDPCKHFEDDRERDPILFTYQSVHYILRPTTEISFENTIIPTSIPCEIQIRTLLQHAHAELTHDAIYKTKRRIKPKVHRTVAKSMALIETTDDFFIDVTKNLNQGPLQENRIIEKLDSIYLNMTGLYPHNQKSATVIWDAFEMFIDDGLIDHVQRFLKECPVLPGIIQKKYGENIFYQQSTILFVYWMLKKRTKRLLADWPLPTSMLDSLANDLGVNTLKD